MDEDRRAHPRSPCSLPCKLYLPGRGRYVAATTSDVSTSGALIRVAGSTGLAVGQRVVMGIAAPSSPGLLRHERMRQAVVMRIDGGEGGVAAVALRFTEAIGGVHASSRRAA